jgi:hypothetical protein
VRLFSKEFNVNELKNFLKNKRNLYTVIGIVLMVAIIPLGVSLTKLRQIFFSQASGNYIQLGEGNCVVTSQGGEKALKCGTVPLVLLNPFATSAPTPTSVPTPTPTPGPTCTTNALSKPLTVNANNSVTATYTYPAGTKITNLNLPANSKLRYSANGQTPAMGQPLSINYGAAASSQIQFTVTTDTACLPFTQAFTMVNNCGTTMNDFVGMGSTSAWGNISCVTPTPTPVPTPTPAPVACQPPPDMGRPTMVKIPGGLRVTRFAQTNSNTPTNILRGMNFTGFSTIRVDFNGRTYKAPANIDLRSTITRCTTSCTEQGPNGAKSVIFDIYPTTGQGGTISFTMEDSCRHITDFAGSASAATFGAGTAPPELPAP